MRENVSPRSKFASLREKWIKLVASNNQVTRGDLILKLGITPQQYYLNASPILETSQGLMEYSKEEKLWTWKGEVMIEKNVEDDPGEAGVIDEDH